VGGVSGRPARAFARCCNGGRHPGPRDADSLRGLSEERGSWSVRSGCVGLVPMQSFAPMTTGVLWKNEEGNVVGVRISARTLRVRRLKSGSRNEDTSFARSRDPCTSRAEHSILSGKLAGKECWGLVRSRYRGRANLGQPGGTGTGVTIPRTNCAARRVSPLVSFGVTRTGQVVREASEKEGGHGHRPCEETRVPDLSSVRRKQLQKSAGSILVSNKHVRSAPKRVTVRVNGDLGAAASGGQTSEATSNERMFGVSANTAVKRWIDRARPRMA